MNKKIDMIKFGPVGGKKGTVWDEKGRGEIAKIFLSSNPTDTDYIHSLQFLFVENGHFVLSDRHGPDYNYSYTTNFTTVVLDYPSEYLTWISGTNYSTGLRSIIFGTNKGSYGPYGSTRIHPSIAYEEFKFEIGDDRSFGGFHGTKHDTFIGSIGVYVKTITSHPQIPES